MCQPSEQENSGNDTGMWQDEELNFGCVEFEGPAISWKHPEGMNLNLGREVKQSHGRE